MSSTNILLTASQPVIMNQVTTTRVQTLQSQLVDLSSDYWVLKGQFAENPLVATFATPDWYDLDTRALNLRKSFHSRSLSEKAPLQEELAEFEALDNIRVQIGDQITALRAQLNASDPVHIPVLPPSQSQLSTRHSRSTCRRRAAKTATVTNSSRQSTLRKCPTRFPPPRVNTPATKDGNGEVVNTHDRRAKRLRLRTEQAEDELRSNGKGSTKVSRANEPYVPEFPGLINFPASTRGLDPAILQSTGKIRKPILAFCKLPRWRIAADNSENMPWTAGVTTAQEIWERRFRGQSGFFSLGFSYDSTPRAVLDEVDSIKNSILEKRKSLAKSEKDKHDEAQEEPSEEAEESMDDGDSDYIP